MPTFALTLAITTVTTYLPVIAAGFAASTVVIGVLIGGEGLVALTLPVVVGAWSDRLRTRIGGRLPFVLGATPPLVLALAALGFVAGILAAAIAVACFFAAYYVAYEPYRALYPDLVDDEIAGRAQSTQALFRGAATGLALVAGLLVPLLTTSKLLVGLATPFVAFGGAAIMTLPYALLTPLMPEGRHGALSGFYSLSRGAGVALGPLLAGVAVSIARGPLGSTQGFAAMWGVCAAAVLASIPLVRRLRDADET